MSLDQQNKADNGHVYDVVIVGMGAAGVGISVALRHAGIENFIAMKFSIPACLRATLMPTPAAPIPTITTS